MRQKTGAGPRLTRSAGVVLFALTPLLADQVVLKNGDVITGEIVKKDGATLTIQSEFLGQVSMPWSAVQTLKSDEPVTVVLPGGESVSGPVATTGGQLEVAAEAGIRAAALDSIEAMRNPAEQRTWERLQNPSIFRLWNGSFDLGLALARGNARTNTLTLAMNAVRATPRDKFKIYYNQIRASARVEGVTTGIASAVRGGWSYNRETSAKVFANLFNDYERDRFQNLNLRFVAGGGLGYIALKRENVDLRLIGGVNYSRENFTDIRRNSGEIHFGDDFVYRFTSATSITQAFRMFPNLSSTGDYRMNFDLGGVTALRSWLAWHVTASNRYLTNPVLGRQRNDVLVSTGFRFSFAR